MEITNVENCPLNFFIICQHCIVIWAKEKQISVSLKSIRGIWDINIRHNLSKYDKEVGYGLVGRALEEGYIDGSRAVVV